MTFKTPTAAPAKKKAGTNKLVLGFAALAATAVVGTTGIAAAATQAQNNKPTKEQCAAAGYKNYGQCVREWAHNNGNGGGYGGGNNNSTNVGIDLDVRGNNNVIEIILNLFRS